MAIEEFGESLLSNVREQNERLARKERKREEKYATYGLGLNLANTIGNQLLAEKTQDFLSNEKIIGARINQNKAIDFANTFIQEQKSIGNQDMGLYFYNKIKPQIEAELQVTTSLGQRANTSQYNALVDQTTKERAKKALAAHLEGYELATKIANEEDFENVIAMNSKVVRPTTMQGWLAGSLRRAFSNKTKEQLDNEALQAILEGPLAENTEAMLKFQKAYIQTNSLEEAVAVTEGEIPPASTTKSEDSIEKVTLPGGGTFLQVVTTVTDSSGNKTIVVGEEQNAEIIEKTFLSRMKKDVDFYDIVYKNFSPTGLSNFYTSLKDAGISLTNMYSSTENVNKTAGILQNLLPNKANYKDKEKADRYNAIISALIPELVGVKNVLLASDKKGNLSEEGINAIISALATAKDIAREVVGDTVDDTVDDTVRDTVDDTVGGTAGGTVYIYKEPKN